MARDTAAASCWRVTGCSGRMNPYAG
jgi:hypothetical protein